jgi:N-methylhydantoinase A/oxoprolinase/acetone carboxylase beta subunit
VSSPGGSDIASALRSAFEAVHEERYGYADPDAPVDLVNARRTWRERGAEVTLHGDAGEQVEGPAVIAWPETTVFVPAGWGGTTDDTGTLVLTWTR